MSLRPAFAKRIFLLAGGYGLIALVPQYFIEGSLSLRFPPPLTHPEHFYGFIGVAIAWQFAFFVIAQDVQRFRSFMLPAVLEKLSFGATTLVLYAGGLVTVPVLCAAAIDLLFAILFTLAYIAAGNVTDSKHTEALNHSSLVFRRAGDMERFS